MNERSGATAGRGPGDGVRIVVMLATLFGGLGRLAAAAGLGPHIDEAASVLAAQMVAERGLPVFPSGVPYFQGATLSYLAAPLTALGAGADGDLFTLRLISVVAGTLAILAVFLLARQVTGRPWVGAAAAIAMAIDPVSIRWSGHVRMYALLELLAALMLLAAARLLQDGPTRRRIALLVAVVWVAIFTQIAAALLLPAIVAMAVYRWRWTLLRERRDVAGALLGCLAAPIGLTLANRVAGGGLSPSTRPDASGVSFVGDHLLALESLTLPTLEAWTALFGDSALAGVTPIAVALGTGIVIGRWALVGGAEDAERRRIGAGLLLLAYWGSALAIAFLTLGLEQRYLLHTMPAACVLMAMALHAIVASGEARETSAVAGAGGGRRWPVRHVGAAALAALLVLHAASGIRFIARHPDVHPNYAQAAAYVEARRAPGERVYTAMTTAAYLQMGADDLFFLPGAATSLRTRNYVRLNAEGTAVDYWIGVPAFSLLNDVCTELLTHPDAWVIVDDPRLWADWAFGEDLRVVIEGLTYLQTIGEGFVLVRRPAPIAGRDPAAERICARAANLAGRGLDESMIEPDDE